MIPKNVMTLEQFINDGYLGSILIVIAAILAIVAMRTMPKKHSKND